MKLCNTQCCGMREIDNISISSDAAGNLRVDKTAEQTLREFCAAVPRIVDYNDNARQKPHLNFALVVFTGVVVRRRSDQFSNRGDNYGQAFADLIVAEGLGDVTAGPTAENPNTSNTVRAWIWRLNVDAVRQRCQQVIDEEVAAKAVTERTLQNDARRAEAASGGSGGGTGTVGEIQRSAEPAWRAISFDEYVGISDRNPFADLLRGGRTTRRPSAAQRRQEAERLLGSHNRPVGNDGGGPGASVSAQIDAPSSGRDASG